MIPEIVTNGIDSAVALATGNGVKAGMFATALLLIWRGHRVLAALQAALNTVRIGFVAAAAVGLLVLIAVGAGWISVSSLPELPALPLSTAAAAGGARCDPRPAPGGASGSEQHQRRRQH